MPVYGYLHVKFVSLPLVNGFREHFINLLSSLVPPFSFVVFNWNVFNISISKICNSWPSYVYIFVHCTLIIMWKILDVIICCKLISIFAIGLKYLSVFMLTLKSIHKYTYVHTHTHINFVVYIWYLSIEFNFWLQNRIVVRTYLYVPIQSSSFLFIVCIVYTLKL